MTQLVIRGKREALFKEWMENDEDFRRWMQKFDSLATQRDYWQRLAELHDATGMTPKTIVARYKAGGETRQKFLDEFEDHLTSLKNRDRVSLARSLWSAVTSLLIHRSALAAQRNFELKQPVLTKITSKYIPTQEEFDTMLRFAKCPRDRYLAAQFRYGGGRRGVVDDPEPMRLSNTLDLDFEALAEGEVRFTHERTCAILLYGTVGEDGEIHRITETYVTFLPPHAMMLLKDYLTERLRSGEKLTPTSYLFLPQREDLVMERPHLTSDRASHVISDMSVAAGFVVKNDKTGEMKAKFTAHSLRRLFYNSLSGIDDVDKEALDGHIKGVRARYHGTVDEMKKAVEFMRERYELGMRAYINTGPADPLTSGLAKLNAARDAGIVDPAVVRKMLTDVELKAVSDFYGQLIPKEPGAGPDEVAHRIESILRLTSRPVARETAKRKDEQREDRKQAKTATNGGSPQPYETCIVGEEELVPLLNQGWNIVKELADGRVIVRRPLRQEEAVNDED